VLFPDDDRVNTAVEERGRLRAPRATHSAEDFICFRMKAAIAMTHWHKLARKDQRFASHVEDLGASEPT
jgi:hypothetical protein